MGFGGIVGGSITLLAIFMSIIVFIALIVFASDLISLVLSEGSRRASERVGSIIKIIGIKYDGVRLYINITNNGSTPILFYKGTEILIDYTSVNGSRSVELKKYEDIVVYRIIVGSYTVVVNKTVPFEITPGVIVELYTTPTKQVQPSSLLNLIIVFSNGVKAEREVYIGA